MYFVIVTTQVLANVLVMKETEHIIMGSTQSAKYYGSNSLWRKSLGLDKLRVFLRFYFCLILFILSIVISIFCTSLHPTKKATVRGDEDGAVCYLVRKY